MFGLVKLNAKAKALGIAQFSLLDLSYQSPERSMVGDSRNKPIKSHHIFQYRWTAAVVTYFNN